MVFAGFKLGQQSARRASRAARRAETGLATETMRQPIEPTIPVATSSGPALVPPVLPDRRTAARAPTPLGVTGQAVPVRVPADAGVGPLDSGQASATAPVETAADSGIAEIAEEPEPEPPAGPVACGSSWCAPGLVCCNAGCGLCAPPGAVCSQRMCGVATAPVSVMCGMSTCNVGYVCCNSSCGTCARPGETCDQKSCGRDMQLPTIETCGLSTCNTGYECCNPSCGICVRPGEACSHEPCGW